MPSSAPQPPEKSPQSQARRSLLDRLAAVVGALSAVVKQAPVAVLFVVVALVLYFRQPQQSLEETPQFNDPANMPKEQPPPAELPTGMNPSVWTCVSRSDTQLSNGLWADIYYGMEARLDGKMLTAKVTEKWQDLSEDKQKTVANLVVDTWAENSQALHLFTSRDELEEIIIQRLPDDVTVARWTPMTGLQLIDAPPGAKPEG